MFIFRASSAGCCLRELVAKALNPAFAKKAPSLQAWLDDGHRQQARVKEALLAAGVPLLGSERTVECPGSSADWKWRGHRDEELAGDEYIEVKSLSPRWWAMLQKETDWRKLYPQYVDQTEVYLRATDTATSYMLFTPRVEDGEPRPMLGGLPAKWVGKLPPGVTYTYRKDMVIHPSDRVFSRLLRTHAEALDWIVLGRVPEFCTKGHECWYCDRGIKVRRIT